MLRNALRELKVDFGPGYRVYYAQYPSVVVLLCGGDKRTQSRDIGMASALKKILEEA